MEYTGSPLHQGIQRRLRQRHDAKAADSGFSNGGSLLNMLEPERIGWSEIRRLVEAEELLGLIAAPRDETLRSIAREFGDTVEAPWWAVFWGIPERALAHCEPIVEAASLPKNWQFTSEMVPSEDVIGAVQTLSASVGVTPSPAYYMRSEAVPHLTTCLWDGAGKLAACAAATDRYHRESRLAKTVFTGPVSVAEQHRGKGLGSLIHAALVCDSHKAFGWRRAISQAKPDNRPSCGMLRRCGFVEDPERATIVINLSGEYVTR